MNTLLGGEERKQNVVDAKQQIRDIVKPLFAKYGIGIAWQKSPVMNAGSVMGLYLKDIPEKKILAIPWVRPTSMTIREMNKNLGNYPRLNVSRRGRELEDDEKIPYMMKLAKKHDIYFLVVLPRTIGETLFWLERYDFPELSEKWKLTYRKDPKVLDRITLTKYKNPVFSTAKQIKQQIKSIVNGN
jgi:hypothetical protein